MSSRIVSGSLVKIKISTSLDEESSPRLALPKRMTLIDDGLNRQSSGSRRTVFFSTLNCFTRGWAWSTE